MIVENCAGYDINVILPEKYSAEQKYPAAFINDGDQLEKFGFTGTDYIIFGIVPHDRLEEYTPWEEKALREHANDFGGQCAKYINTLVHEIYSSTAEEISSNR